MTAQMKRRPSKAPSTSSRRGSRHYPDAYIYHYASYEESALKRLAMLHGTREVGSRQSVAPAQARGPLQSGARSGAHLRARYSIKNVEAFYLEQARSGEVTTAGESIMIYERFRRLGNSRLLKQIEDYNKIDCQSLRMCRDWLISSAARRTCPWPAEIAPEKAIPRASRSGSRPNSGRPRISQALTAGCPSEERPWRELLALSAGIPSP